MEFNKAAILTVATAVGTVLSAVAMNGEKALAALSGVPGLLQAWASELPLGAWSFALATALGTLAWLVLIVKLPKTDGGRAAHFSADTLVLCLALIVTLSQQAMASRAVGALLNAMWLGGVAGLLAPYIGRGLRAVFTRPQP